jgi:hypothetical protein
LLGLLTIGLLVCAWWVAVLIGCFSRIVRMVQGTDTCGARSVASSECGGRI